MNEVKRIRCINKTNGRVRFIIETLCTPRWLERHGLRIETIETPATDAVKKGKHQEVDARGLQAETSNSDIAEPSKEEAEEVDAFADFTTKPRKTKKTN